MPAGRLGNSYSLPCIARAFRTETTWNFLKEQNKLNFPVNWTNMLTPPLQQIHPRETSFPSKTPDETQQALEQIDNCIVAKGKMRLQKSSGGHGGLTSP